MQGHPTHQPDPGAVIHPKVRVAMELVQMRNVRVIQAMHASVSTEAEFTDKEIKMHDSAMVVIQDYFLGKYDFDELPIVYPPKDDDSNETKVPVTVQ